MPINEALLDQKLSQLEAVHPWSPRVISKLETLIRTADDYTLFRLNPLHYATEKNMDVEEAIALFLHSTKLGLFEIEWHMVCAYCAHVFKSLHSMEGLHSHFVCDLCEAVNDISLDDYIQVAFTLAPAVRPLKFHDPDSLTIEELLLQYGFAKGIAPLPDGSRLLEDLVPLINKGMFFLPPQGKKVSEMDLPTGRMHTFDISNKTGVTFWLTDDSHPALQVVPLHVQGGKMQPQQHPVAPKDLVFTLSTIKLEQYGELQNGKIALEVVNLTEKKIPIWILHYPPQFDLFLIPFEPFLSGKHLLTNQTFRTLFRSETVHSDEGLSVQDITFLFTDLKGSTAMYDAIGDPQAYFLVRQHFETLGRVVSQHRGAIVKTIGDAIMATFMTPQDALQAALAMLKDIEEFNQQLAQDLSLKIGIHRGHSIVVTLNERLDYFGQTVNIAARVQGLADADEIYITRSTYEALAGDLENYALVPQQVEVKGVSTTLEVYKITLKP